MWMRMMCALSLTVFWLAVQTAVAQSWNTGTVFTSSEDFAEGDSFNLDDTGGQLEVPDPGRLFPYVNMACSNRGTVVRIYIGSGDNPETTPPYVVGEYWTSPDGMQRNPSRTTVDHHGNVWVANRDEDGLVQVGEDFIEMGSITRIALVEGGTRCDANGTPNENGQYLKPPFSYSSVPWEELDADSDGLLKTSRGLGDILPWTNDGGIDSNGGGQEVGE